MIVQVGQWVLAILVFVLILGVLVIAHELGHFVTARLAGIRVLEFGLGFPPRAKILGSDGETIYTLNWLLPLGGFVRLEGEDEDTGDPRSFSRASLPRQVVVLAAGATMNVVVAFVLFFLVAWLANPLVGVRFDRVEPGSPAAQAGLAGGETIQSVDGQRFGWMSEAGILEAIRAHAGQTVSLGIVDTAGHARTVQTTLRTPAQIAALQKADGQAHGTLGISSAGPTGMQPVFSYVQTDPISASQMAASQTTSALGLILGGLRDLGASIVANPTTAPPAAGPVGIAEQVHNSLWDVGPVFVILLAGLLSANLALVNILPFPPLDGGRIAVLVIKRVVGSRTTSALERFTYVVGFVLLLSFIVWISYFDIARGLAGP